MRLLLVDGSNYFYRAHYAMPNLQNSQGVYTGALYGMVSMLRKLRQTYPSDYLVCVFDTPAPTFRHLLYPQYKANRDSMPGELVMQIQMIPELIQGLGWTYLAVPSIEADDVIGTMAIQAAQDGLDVLIATGDKDMAQLVNDKIHLIDTMNDRYMDIGAVIGKFGVRPDQIVDYLTLMGDSSDNVPGIEKVGPKTAAKWLKTYHTLENILHNKMLFTGVVGDHLKKAAEWLPTTKKLLAIHTQCHDLIEAYVPHWQQWRPFNIRDEDIGTLIPIFQTLEFKSWLFELNKIKTQDYALNSTDAPKQQGLMDADAPDYTCITTANIKAYLARAAQATCLAVDTETTHIHPLKATLVGVSLAWQEDADIVAVYIPIQHQAQTHDQTQALSSDDLRILAQLLATSNLKKVGQNIKYDLHVLARHGMPVAGLVDDTMLASYVLASHQTHNLDDLAMRHLQLKTITYQEVSQQGKLAFDQVDIEAATQYAAQDADFTLRLHQHFEKHWSHTAPELRHVYHEIEVPVAHILQKMEAHGVLLDVEFLHAEHDILQEKIDALELQIHEHAGESFNVHSPKQVGHILFDILKLPVLKRTAQKAPSTDEEVLHKLALQHALPAMLLEHRTLAKLQNTYVDKLPTMVDPQTHRVHTQLAQHLTISGRLSSSEPNLQNIPIKTAQGRRIRQAFIAPPGHQLVAMDYSQIELRILAHLSQDAQLLAAFHSGEDIHTITAAQVFHHGSSPEHLAKVSSDERRYAKSINFGLMYGMSAFGLSQQLGIDAKTAQTYIDGYFAQYPSILTFFENLKKNARTKGYVETIAGRRIYLQELASGPYQRRQAAERLAMNAPMQGSAADIIKLAMIAIDTHIQTQKLNTKMILQVHDELLFEVPHDEYAYVNRHFAPIMQSVYPLAVPLLVNISAGDRWGAMHGE